MATVQSITIEYTYTFNLGNYSSIKPFVSLTAVLTEGDSPADVAATMLDVARRQVEAEIDQTLEAAGRAPYFRQIKEGAKAPDDELPF